MKELDATDPSKDTEILAMSPIEKLELLFAWEMGDDRWANIVLEWMRECGYEITQTLTADAC